MAIDPTPGIFYNPSTTITLRYVTRLTEQQARMKLNQLGFTTIARSNTAPVQQGYQVGQVMAIDPTPGIFYNPSTMITLTIAVKPACPTPTPTPTPTPSATPSPSASGTGTGTPSATPSSTPPASTSAAPTPNPSCTPG